MEVHAVETNDERERRKNRSVKCHDFNDLVASVGDASKVYFHEAREDFAVAVDDVNQMIAMLDRVEKIFTNTAVDT